MSYTKYHEIDENPETNQHLAEIMNSLVTNGWQGRPLLAIGDQLVTGCHRMTACELLGIEPEVHEAEITLNWGDDDDWMLSDLANASRNDMLLLAMETMLEAGYIDEYSVELMRAEEEN
jgi:hypothetical protein